MAFVQLNGNGTLPLTQLNGNGTLPPVQLNANNISFNGETFSTMILGHNTTLNAEVSRENFVANIVEFQGASNI
jgi:hypothetical protein